MVEDRIVDGYRIAELLASEVDGRRDGPLGRLAVANPDRTVEGTPEGERAYDVRRLAADRDPRREPAPDEVGPLVAAVFVHEEGATVAVHEGREAAADAADAASLAVEPEWRDDALAIRLAYAAQAKRGADVLAAAAECDD